MTHLVVIGHTGQLARELRELALPAGWRRSSLDRTTLDLTRPENFEAVLTGLQPGVIINAAGYTSVDTAEAEEDIAMLTNGRAPGEIARVARLLGAPLLHVSTDYVFDGQSAQPYTEQDTPNPINAYGRTKLAGEMAILAAGARAVILRTGWMFGRFGHNFLRTVFNLASQREAFPVVCDQRGGPTPARDVAESLVLMAQRLVDQPDTQAGIFHYSGRPCATWAEFAATIVGSANWPGPTPQVVPVSTSQFPSAATRPRYSVLECSKLQQAYGIVQPVWQDGVLRALDDLDHGLRGDGT